MALVPNFPKPTLIRIEWQTRMTLGSKRVKIGTLNSKLIPDGLSSSESLAYAVQSELRAEIPDVPLQSAGSELSDVSFNNLS